MCEVLLKTSYMYENESHYSSIATISRGENGNYLRNSVSMPEAFQLSIKRLETCEIRTTNLKASYRGLEQIIERIF